MNKGIHLAFVLWCCFFFLLGQLVGLVILDWLQL